LTTDTPFERTPPPPPSAALTRQRGWFGSDLAIGSSLIVMLIALFLPWFSGVPQPQGAPTTTASATGPRVHGYLWFVFALAIVALAVLVAREAIDRIPGNLPSTNQILVGATGLSLLLILLGILFRQDSIGFSYGGFIALLAALVAFIAAAGIAGPLSGGRRVGSRPMWKRSRTGS
jgi:hypothetical protein